MVPILITGTYLFETFFSSERPILTRYLDTWISDQLSASCKLVCLRYRIGLAQKSLGCRSVFDAPFPGCGPLTNKKTSYMGVFQVLGPLQESCWDPIRISGVLKHPSTLGQAVLVKLSVF